MRSVDDRRACIPLANARTLAGVPITCSTAHLLTCSPPHLLTLAPRPPRSRSGSLPFLRYSVSPVLRYFLDCSPLSVPRPLPSPMLHAAVILCGCGRSDGIGNGSRSIGYHPRGIVRRARDIARRSRGIGRSAAGIGCRADGIANDIHSAARSADRITRGFCDTQIGNTRTASNGRVTQDCGIAPCNRSHRHSTGTRGITSHSSHTQCRTRYPRVRSSMH